MPQEERHWDISSGERLELLKRFCSAGLVHWGSDRRGVETTRCDAEVHPRQRPQCSCLMFCIPVAVSENDQSRCSQTSTAMMSVSIFPAEGACSVISWGSYRRFLLEWLSFSHRYVPVGLLEHPAAVLNWRTPAYVGRNDLETLFASDHPADWVRTSSPMIAFCALAACELQCSARDTRRQVSIPPSSGPSSCAPERCLAAASANLYATIIEAIAAALAAQQRSREHDVCLCRDMTRPSATQSHCCPA